MSNIIKTIWGNVEIIEKTSLGNMYECKFIYDDTISNAFIPESDLYLLERNTLDIESIDSFIDEEGNEIEQNQFLKHIKDGMNAELIIEGDQYITHQKFAVLSDSDGRDLQKTMKALQTYYLNNSWNEELNDDLQFKIINFSKFGDI